MPPDILHLDSPIRADLERLSIAVPPRSEHDPNGAALIADDGWGVSRARWERRIRFPDETAARHWNACWEAMLGNPGELLQPLFVMNGAPIAEPGLSAVAQIAAILLRDEVRGGMPCPEVHEGWSFELLIAQSWRPTRMPELAEDVLLVLLDAGWRDARGESLWFVETLRECPMSQLPRRAPDLLLSIARRETTEIYVGK